MAGLDIITMHRVIRLGLQQIDANAADGFQREEIDLYINETINDYVKAQFSALKRQDFTVMEEAVLENIRTLVVVETYPLVATESDSIPNALSVDLPESDPSPSPGDPSGQYYYFIHGHVTVDGKLRTLSLTSFYHLRAYLRTESNVPVFRRIPIVIKENTVHLLREKGDEVYSDLMIAYVREPLTVDYNAETSCDLPPHTHYEITDAVVRRMTRDIMQQRAPQQEQQPEA